LIPNAVVPRGAAAFSSIGASTLFLFLSLLIFLLLLPGSSQETRNAGDN
jgi:hypothetical protein